MSLLAYFGSSITLNFGCANKNRNRKDSRLSSELKDFNPCLKFMVKIIEE